MARGKTGPNLRAQARNEAIALLIYKHADEFDGLLRDAHIKRNIEYVRPMTAEEKAAERLAHREAVALNKARAAFVQQGLPVPAALKEPNVKKFASTGLDEFAKERPESA